MKTTHWAPSSLLAATLALAACGGGGGISGTGSSTNGTLRISLTDAPSCGYDQVNVTVQKVRVHQSAGAGENDSGWSEIVLAQPRKIDLNTLTNGVLAELGETTLPSGRYTQLRLVLAENGGATPLANSVVPEGGTETALDTPSALQSGLKLNVNIDVTPEQRADFVVDFDACKSVVRRGNSGRYNLKPVLTVTPRLSDAGMRVVGWVSPALANGSTNVSVQLNGLPVKATPPDATGQFVLYPVPAGTYDLVISNVGHVTAVMTGVPVITTAYTYVNSASAPFAPASAASAARTVTGTVTPATATVRVLQALTGGPTVEVAWAPVDALNGSFSAALPVDAPVKAAYSSTVAPVFTPDTAAAARYSFEARSGSAVPLTQAVNVSAPVAPLVFTFP
jgi:Domain of unknown function (DUF4382)